MPPQSTQAAGSSTPKAYPRPLNRLEKQFVSHHARIAAAIMFAQDPRPRAEVMEALEKAAVSHPVGFAQLDADGNKLDWHNLNAGEMPELQVRERAMPAWAAGDGKLQTLPHDFVARDDQSGPMDITLLVEGADQIGGVVLNASHALLDGASLKPLVETLVRNLNRDPEHRTIVPSASNTPPPLFDREMISSLFHGRPLPPDYLPLDPRFQPSNDSTAAVKSAVATRERFACIESKEETAREKIIKLEGEDLHDVFKSEHKDFEKMKKAEEKAHATTAAMFRDQIKQLRELEKSLVKLTKAESDKRHGIVKEQTSELTHVKHSLKDESKTHMKQEKMLLKQAQASRAEQKELVKEEKKLSHLADKKSHALQKKGVGPKLQPHLEKQQELYRRITHNLHDEREQLALVENDLKLTAAEDHAAATLITHDAQNVKQRSLMAPEAAKELDKDKQRALDEARDVIHKQQAALKERETHFAGLSKVARDEAKVHAKHHNHELEAKLAELEHERAARAASGVKVPELLFLSPKDIFGPNYNAKGGHRLSAEERSHFLELPRSQINSIIHATGGSQDHLLAYLAAAFAVGVLSQAQAHDAIRSYLDQGGHRVGVTFAVASDLRDAKSEVDARRGNVSYPLLCTGFITAAIVFEEHELRRAVGYGSRSSYGVASPPPPASRSHSGPASPAGEPALPHVVPAGPGGPGGERHVDPDQSATLRAAGSCASGSIATKFELAAIAQRFLLEIHRRIERGEAHRSALSQADGDTQMAPPQALIALTNVGLIRDAEGISVELRQFSDRQGPGIVEGETLSVLSWGSTAEGHVHLSIDADPNSDLDGIRNITRLARAAFARASAI
jgi:hypothetical protein